MSSYNYILKSVDYFYREVFKQNYTLDFVVSVATSGFLLFQFFLLNVILASFDIVSFLLNEVLIYIFLAVNTAFNYYLIKRKRVLNEVDINPKMAKALVIYFFLTIPVLVYYIILTR